jgi:hypothetical protein
MISVLLDSCRLGALEDLVVLIPECADLQLM